MSLHGKIIERIRLKIKIKKQRIVTLKQNKSNKIRAAYALSKKWELSTLPFQSHLWKTTQFMLCLSKNLGWIQSFVIIGNKWVYCTVYVLTMSLSWYNESGNSCKRIFVSELFANEDKTRPKRWRVASKSFVLLVALK